MGALLDLEDVVSGHPKAREELDELYTALEQAIDSLDIISDRLLKYQCEGRSLDSIHDVFEVARMGQSLRVFLMPNLEGKGLAEGESRGARSAERT